MDDRRADVAVVGAGLAGLVAARDLVRTGRTVVVCEARDRVGGRTLNHTLTTGDVVEVGGEWIGPGQDRVAALAAELGVETFPTYDQGGSIFLVGGSPDGPSTMDPEAFAEAGAIFEELDAMAAALPPDAPWLADQAEEWDSQTFHTWMTARTASRPARSLLRLLVGAIFTAEPAELSLLHVLAYIGCAGSLSRLTGDAQQDRLVGGSQVLALRLAERLGDAVVTSAPVRRIRQDDAGVTVQTDDMAVHAARAVVAVPVPLADRIVYHPPLPGFRSQLHQRMAPGAVIKVNVVYERPFWRDRGLNGRALCDVGPITLTFDNSPPSGSPGVLVGFAEADHARRLARMDPQTRREAVLDCFVRHFGQPADFPVEYVEKDWSSEEWTRGCYGANFGPGGWTRYGEALREPFGRVHWAGAETATVWMNYMDGAVRSGERAAAEVAALL